MTRHPFTQHGFTIIELMITLVVAALLITVGVPGLADFVASQRIRATTSDIMADMAYARAEAIKESRTAILERLGGVSGTWKSGWQVCVDFDNNGSCSNTEVRKATTNVPGRSKVCATATDFNDRILFRPDGRVNRTSAPGANDGIKVSDDINDADTTNDRVRLIFLGLSGRARMEIQDNDANNPTRGTACP